MDTLKEWLEHKTQGLVSALVTAGLMWASKRWNLGLTADQILVIGGIVTGGLFAHGAANSHAANSNTEGKSNA